MNCPTCNAKMPDRNIVCVFCAKIKSEAHRAAHSRVTHQKAVESGQLLEVTLRDRVVIDGSIRLRGQRLHLCPTRGKTYTSITFCGKLANVVVNKARVVDVGTQPPGEYCEVCVSQIKGILRSRVA